VLRLRVDNLAWREFDGQGILLDLRSSTYLAANESATVLWRLLAAGTTRAKLIDALVAGYRIAPERAAADSDAFLADCRAHGYLDE
jgi:hypothetical protein